MHLQLPQADVVNAQWKIKTGKHHDICLVNGGSPELLIQRRLGGTKEPLALAADCSILFLLPLAAAQWSTGCLCAGCRCGQARHQCWSRSKNCETSVNLKRV
mmetsp:Transcript_135754/g.264225  ORF Transcript_135754/g.264225 Transcript_135754/m.264225 type:complete len:102 (+) Transcript_135754:80-385(+)